MLDSNSTFAPDMGLQSAQHQDHQGIHVRQFCNVVSSKFESLNELRTATAFGVDAEMGYEITNTQ